MLMVGMGFAVSVHKKLAMRAILNGSTEVAEITGAVHANIAACVDALMKEVRYYHQNMPIIVFFTKM